MCVGIPGKIIEINSNQAKILQGDHFHWVDISTISKKVEVGDYVICYQDAAINRISPDQAKEILELMNGAGNTGVEGAD